MAKKKKQLYPGIEAAEMERGFAGKKKNYDDQPDLLFTAGGICPNYEKFHGWDAEKVLAWCNID